MPYGLEAMTHWIRQGTLQLGSPKTDVAMRAQASSLEGPECWEWNVQLLLLMLCIS